MRVLSPRQHEGCVERISALDRSNLRIEERGMPMHMTALALLAGDRGGLPCCRGCGSGA